MQTKNVRYLHNVRFLIVYAKQNTERRILIREAISIAIKLAKERRFRGKSYAKMVRTKKILRKKTVGNCISRQIIFSIGKWMKTV